MQFYGEIKTIMKKGLTFLHGRDFHSNGQHARYFIMTITTAFLLATGMVIILFVIGKNFFNW